MAVHKLLLVLVLFPDRFYWGLTEGLGIRLIFPDQLVGTSLIPTKLVALVSSPDQLVALVSSPDQLVGTSLIPRPAGW